ncbi:MAG TPA: hypothetical protein VKD26_01465 [Streptosporangiaceae bacterium]|nr:hypothetical protein [Streptosporangiaceae bacterium]
MTILFIVAVLAGLGYLFSLHVHPYTQCHSCKGGGRHRGAVFGYGNRACGSCGGNGRQLRLGVRVFLGGTEKK